jgi:hypothetical protein
MIKPGYRKLIGQRVTYDIIENRESKTVTEILYVPRNSSCHAYGHAHG